MGAPGNRGASLFPEGRTYSPPAIGGRWYPSRWSGSCALRGGCGSCGSLWTIPHSCGIAVIVHAVGALLFAEIAALFVQQCVPTACENLPPVAFHSDGYRPGDPHFLFTKKKQKQVRRNGETEWRSIIWKQKLSAVAQGDPLLPPLRI